MAITQNTFTGDGSTVLFSFTFPYLDESHIKVSLNGSDTILYTLANATTIQMNTAPANGVAIRIYRNTDSSSLEAQFFSGSSIRAQDLNDNFTQIIFKTQETENFAASTDSSAIAGTAALAVSTANTAVSVANTALSTVNTALPISGGIMTGQLLGDNSGTAAAPAFAFDTDLNTGLFWPGADQVAVATNGAGRLFVDASGNISIATSAVAYFPKRFNVRSESGAVATFSSADTATGAADTGVYLEFRHNTGSGGEVGAGEFRFLKENSTIGNNSTYFAITTRLNNAQNERLRITSAGLVGIGTSSPTEKLTVSGNVSVSGNVQAASINNGPLAGMRNAIINGNFDIWQRGTSDFGEGFWADRWNAYLVAGISMLQSRYTLTDTQRNIIGYEAAYAWQVFTSDTTSSVQLQQPIEGAKTFANQQISVSFWAFTDAGTCTISSLMAQSFGSGGSPSVAVETPLTLSATTITTTPTKITAVVTLPSITGKTLGTDPNSDSLSLVIRKVAGAANRLRIARVQVEPGPVATPFERRPIGTELALCQRYHYKSDQEITALSPYTAPSSASDLLVDIQFPVTMRATPTIALGTQSPGGGGATLPKKDGFRFGGIVGAVNTPYSVLGFAASAEL